MRPHYTKKSILSSLSTLFLFFSVHCGQSGGSEAQGLEDEVLYSSGGDDLGDDYLYASGRIIDGPVSGATVFLDCNGNLIHDEGEAKTTSKADGTYQFSTNVIKGRVIALAQSDSASYVEEIDQSKCKVVSMGGHDTGSNKSVENLQLVADLPDELSKGTIITGVSTAMAGANDERAKQKILDTLCYGGEVGKGGTIEDALTRDIWELAKQGEELAILQLKINMQLSFAVMAIVDTENGKTGSEETANKIDKLSTVLASLGGPDECVELDDEDVLETVLTGSAGVDKSEVEGSLQNLLKKAKEVSNASSEELLKTSLTQKIGGFYSAVKNIQCLNQDKLKELSDNISISKCSEDSLTEKADEAACLRIASQETISDPLRIDILGKDINYQDDSLTATSNGAFVDYFDKDNSSLRPKLEIDNLTTHEEFNFKIKDDDLYEGDESLQVIVSLKITDSLTDAYLSSSCNKEDFLYANSGKYYPLLDDTRTNNIYSIKDNDKEPQATSIAASKAAKITEDAKFFDVTVTFSSAYPEDKAYDISYPQDGSNPATKDSDFSGPSSTTLKAGEKTLTFQIDVTDDDTEDESEEETITVSVSGKTIEKTVVDNDVTPTITFTHFFENSGLIRVRGVMDRTYSKELTLYTVFNNNNLLKDGNILQNNCAWSLSNWTDRGDKFSTASGTEGCIAYNNHPKIAIGETESSFSIMLDPDYAGNSLDSIDLTLHDLSNTTLNNDLNDANNKLRQLKISAYKIKDISSNKDNHNCATLIDGNDTGQYFVKCWGDNTNSKLGLGYKLKGSYGSVYASTIDNSKKVSS